jgi:hypothetical protein
LDDANKRKNEDSDDEDGDPDHAGKRRKTAGKRKNEDADEEADSERAGKRRKTAGKRKNEDADDEDAVPGVVMTIDQLAAFDVDKKKGKPGFHLANGPAMLSNLYRVIESGDYTEFIWWMKDGQAFKIKNKKSFQKEVLQKCNVSDIASSNWFSGISRSGLRRFLKEGNAYYHPKGYFVKGRPELCPLGHMEKRNLNQALDIWNKTLKEGKYYEGKKLPMPLKPGKD